MTVSFLFYDQRQYYSIVCHLLREVSLCFCTKINPFASLKKVTNRPIGRAVNDGIIFTLLYRSSAEVKGGTLLAEKMDWLLDW